MSKKEMQLIIPDSFGQFVDELAQIKEAFTRISCAFNLAHWRGLKIIAERGKNDKWLWYITNGKSTSAISVKDYRTRAACLKSLYRVTSLFRLPVELGETQREESRSVRRYEDYKSILRKVRKKKASVK